jgi:hypothetical protein
MEEQTNNVENQVEVSENTAITEENNSTHATQTPIEIHNFDDDEKLGNLPMAIVFGLLASIISAGLWATITVVTGYQIGYMAIAVGFLVGYTVKFAGRGNQLTFGIIGAVLSLFGCVLGNYFSMVGFSAQELGTGYFSTLLRIPPGLIFDAMTSNFSPMDLVFYGLAVYEGFKFSLLG